jgi:ParB family transcriptional regulator, chromosome partitioning protein
VEAVKMLGWSEIPAVVREDINAQAYIQTLVENLQRKDLTPVEEGFALRVLVRERGWTTHQVGAAIKRSHMFVSRRLRVFDDPVLAPLIVQTGLPVSAAEELLRAANPEMRQALASQAPSENWTPAEARKAVANAKRNDQVEDDNLATELKTLRKMVLDLDAEHVAPSTFAEAQRLLRALQRFVRKKGATPS